MYEKMYLPFELLLYSWRRGSRPSDGSDYSEFSDQELGRGWTQFDYLMADIYQFLRDYNIAFTRFDHSAVFTCEEADRLCPAMPGTSIKNLFLRDSTGTRHFLVVVGKDKNVDLKKLKETLNLSKLSFASEERLQKYLGVTPGAVTLLGLIHDTEGKVEVIIDAGVWGQALQCHPLVNTASLVVPHEGIEKFLQATHHAPCIMDVPSR